MIDSFRDRTVLDRRVQTRIDAHPADNADANAAAVEAENLIRQARQDGFFVIQEQLAEVHCRLNKALLKIHGSSEAALEDKRFDSVFRHVQQLQI